jgi:uncharacterized protein YggE
MAGMLEQEAGRASWKDIGHGRAWPAWTVVILILLAAAWLAGCSESGSVQQGEAGELAVRDTISVSGTGTVLAAPDEAVLTVTVETEADEAAPAADENAQKMQAVVDRLKSEGLPDEALETSSVSVFPVQEFTPDGQSSVRSYRAQNTMRVTINELDQVASLYAAVIEAGANNVQGPEWRLSDNSVAVQEALSKAVASARGKAEALAQAADAGVGDVLSLSEETTVPGPFFDTAARAEAAAGDVAVPPIEPQQLTVTATVRAVYQLSR